MPTSDRPRRDVVDDDRSCLDYRTLTNRHPRKDGNVDTEPHVVFDDHFVDDEAIVVGDCLAIVVVVGCSDNLTAISGVEVIADRDWTFPPNI